MKNYDYIASDISEWLKTYLIKNNLKTFVVGVSGGIDSAVVSTLCAKTLMPVIILNIPILSTEKNTNLSDKHCKWLSSKFSNVKYIKLDLSDAYNKFFNSIKTQLNIDNKLANANTKSRHRMMALYHVATEHLGLVVGTGNKVEDFGVGFFTKYGDGGVDISPIADLSKTDVRELGKCLGVCNEIITAAPTDGLWDDDRTDEQQIGASYEELEWAMENINFPESSLTYRQKQVIKIYKMYNSKNKHKMTSIPVYKLKNNKQ